MKKTTKTKSKSTIRVKTDTKKPGQSVNVYDLEGKIIGHQEVSKQIFDAKINPVLVAQAVRVYLTNQRSGNSSTKTRGEVSGSTRKLYRQKGTGRARQGSRRAPHRVGGGIAFGPKPKEYFLKLPKKAKRAALFSVLSSKFKSGEVLAIEYLDKIEPKTKTIARTLQKIADDNKNLLVLDKRIENVFRATRNLQKVNCVQVNNLNTYNILTTDKVIFTRQALKNLEDIYLKENDLNAA